MFKNKKGMTAGLTLIIVAVILLVVSLIVITIVSSGMDNFFMRTSTQSNNSNNALTCSTAVSFCNLQINSACASSGNFIGDNLEYSNKPCTGLGSWNDVCGGLPSSC
ncbi:MAG: hypothetical protein K0B02_04860 [DPANN group archaeon]|nr:hypothetical protein [DPANN group archaeon]